MDREPARQTSEPGSNPNGDATVHPVCETFNIMHAVQCVHFKTITLNVQLAQLQADAAEARSLLRVSK